LDDSPSYFNIYLRLGIIDTIHKLIIFINKVEETFLNTDNINYFSILNTAKMIDTAIKEEYNPSLKDLENALAEERNKLATYSFPRHEDKIKIISKIRVLRSSIEMLTAYKSYIHQ
jgi:hypothetical protein